jgi:hypothetical protein
MLREHLSEEAIQRAVVSHYRRRAAPNTFMFSVPNGGFRRPVDAAILKATGTTPGVPDTIWIRNGRIYAMELKAEGGRVSAAQLATMAQMRAAGATVAVGVGLDAAIAVLEDFGLLRGRASLSDRNVAPAAGGKAARPEQPILRTQGGTV